MVLKKIGNFTTMTNCELIQMLSDGYTIVEISKKKNLNRRTLEKRVIVLRERCLCKTVGQLIANYIRKNLIE